METINSSDNNIEPAIPIAPAPAKDGAINARDAMRSVVDWRRKSAAGATEQSQGTEQRQEAAPEPATESTAHGSRRVAQEGAAPHHEADDTAAETPPRETGTPDRSPGHGADPAEMPPIEPPRSWSKEDKELFNGLPRETQER